MSECSKSLHVIAERRQPADTRLCFSVPHAHDVVASTARNKAAGAKRLTEGSGTNGARVTGERNRGSNVSYLPVPFRNAHDLQHFIIAARSDDAAIGAPCNAVHAAAVQLLHALENADATGAVDAAQTKGMPCCAKSKVGAPRSRGPGDASNDLRVGNAADFLKCIRDKVVVTRKRAAVFASEFGHTIGSASNRSNCSQTTTGGRRNACRSPLPVVVGKPN